MTTYAEKADIAAKAVRVLDSVKMRRQRKAAEQYALLAEKALRDWELFTEKKYGKGTGDVFGQYVVVGAGDRVISALKRMVTRVADKPRYTLKEGEWVRKWAPEQCGAGLLSHAGSNDYRNAQRQYNARMASAAVNMGMGQPSFGGVSPHSMANPLSLNGGLI